MNRPLDQEPARRWYERKGGVRRELGAREVINAYRSMRRAVFLLIFVFAAGIVGLLVRSQVADQAACERDNRLRAGIRNGLTEIADGSQDRTRFLDAAEPIFRNTAHHNCPGVLPW